MTVIPPIKCQGIKTKLVPRITEIIPSDFEGRWIEPFMGSGVVAFNVQPKRALLADSNPHLIRFYQAISAGEITASRTRSFLVSEGSKLLETEGEHYYAVRERFNKNKEPLDFLFLNRACFNGMIRFNRKGGFNVPFCRKPSRFAAAYITKIVNQVNAVSQLCSLGEYEFRHQEFSDTVGAAESGDLVYCDPPYIDRHTDYFNGWDAEHETKLAASLADTAARFILSTWHSNKYRKNEFLESIWASYEVLTQEHFYHVGAKESNRHPMLEALVTNYSPSPRAKRRKQTQLNLVPILGDSSRTA